MNYFVSSLPRFFLFLVTFAGTGLSADIDLSRLKIEDQLTKKSSNHYGSINDKRQDIGGYLTLRDVGSSLNESMGRFSWKTILFGKPCGRESANAEWLVLCVKEGESDLPIQGFARMAAEPVSTVYDKVGTGKYGFEYFGYAVVVRSSSNPEKFLVKSNKKILEQSADKLEALKAGQLLDKTWAVVREGVRPSEGIWCR